MRLFLELLGIMIMMRLIPLPTVAGTNEVAEMQLNFWRENLPSIQVPEAIAASVSPLTQEEVNTFVKIIKGGNLRSHATQFCNSANLLCFQSVYVTPTVRSGFGTDNFELDKKSDIFFSAEELREGGQIPLPDLYIPSKAFLPRNLSQLIPFATAALSDVVSSFSISWTSNMTKNMNNTLIACEEPNKHGEKKKCSPSIEGMIEFVVSNLGSSDNLELVFHPSFTADAGKKARVSKVVERLSGPSNRPPLSCHRFVYPYGVFYCHYINGTSAFTMELEVLEKSGNVYNATALCHPIVQRKGSVYCHLIFGDTLLWLTKDKH